MELVLLQALANAVMSSIFRYFRMDSEASRKVRSVKAWGVFVYILTSVKGKLA